MKNVGSARMRTNRQEQQGTRSRQVYIEGSAARKLQSHQDRNIRKTRTNAAKPKQRIKTAPMNYGYLAVMIIAIIVVGGVLIGYVRLQSDITNRVNNIAKMESQLNELKLSNDEMYTKIMSNVDLEEIKRIAINELGMKYAKEGQVVTYSGEGSDYVQQYKEIPNAK